MLTADLHTSGDALTHPATDLTVILSLEFTENVV